MGISISYRARQFWLALTARPSDDELQSVRLLLNPVQFSLFLQMQPGEQAHSIDVMRKIQSRTQQDGQSPAPDLLIAALLHDVGKIRCPINVWERIFIVCVKTVAPGWASHWAKSDLIGWKRSFVVSEYHAEWGAQMAQSAGASILTGNLIRRHQDARRTPIQGDSNRNQTVDGVMSVYQEDDLLKILQEADSDS